MHVYFWALFAYNKQGKYSAPVPRAQKEVIQMADQNKKMIRSNPVLSRLSKEKSIDIANENAATYSGIFNKTLMFLLFTVLGIVLYCTVAKLAGWNPAFDARDTAHIWLENYSDSGAVISRTPFCSAELISMGVAGLCTFILPFVCCFSISATPVCGSLYCMAEGWTLSFMLYKLLPYAGYEDATGIGLLALMITIAVVGVMGYLYAKRIIRVTARFRGIMMTMAFSFIGVGLLMLVLSFIPGTRELVSQVADNFGVSIVVSLFSIVLATLFLISDFDTVEQCVTEGMDKRYEWMASFGLAFTIIWLYLKILNLLLRIISRAKDR